MKYASLVFTRRLFGIAVLVSACFCPSSDAMEVPVQKDSVSLKRLEFSQVGEVDGIIVSRARSGMSEDGGRVVTRINAGPKGAVARIWNSQTLKPITELLPQPSLKDSVLSGDGRTLITTDYREVRIWDVETSKVRSSVNVTDDRIYCLDMNHDGTDFLTVSLNDDKVAWIRHTTGNVPALPLRHRSSLHLARFDRPGLRILTQESSYFHLWATTSGREEEPAIDADDAPHEPATCGFDRQGQCFVVSKAKGFEVLGTKSRKTVAEGTLDLAVNEVRFDTDGTKVIVTTWARPGRHGPVFIFNAKTGKMEGTFGNCVIACELAAGGRWALCRVSEQDGEVGELWDREMNMKVRGFGELHSVVRLSPDGSTIAVNDKPEKTTIWRLGEHKDVGER